MEMSLLILSADEGLLGLSDTSFFYFTITVLRWVKFYVFMLFVVVSTSSVVWSLVRWFFLLRNVFCAINHDEQHESL